MSAVYFGIMTFLCQTMALSGAIISWRFYPHVALSLLTATAVGFISSRSLRLPASWQLINSAMPCSAALLLSISIPSWILLLITVSLAAVYAPALWTRVPLYPTPTESYAAILADLPNDRPFSFIDVGSGTGQLLIFLAKHRPNGVFVGVEAAPTPYLISLILKNYYRATNVSVRMQDFWKTDMSSFEWVYTFLSPAAMPKIWAKVQSEMRQGTFITNTFQVPAEPSEVVSINNLRCSALYIHRISADQDGRLQKLSAPFATLPKDNYWRNYKHG